MTWPNDVIEVELHGVLLWIDRDDLERNWGPLMPTATHDQDTLGEDSYAHLFQDGSILRYCKRIGDVSELVETGLGYTRSGAK